MKSDLIDIELKLHHETEKAILVSVYEDSNRVWLPKSQIEFVLKPKGIVEVTLPEWLATDKGLT